METTDGTRQKDIHTSFGLSYANYLVLPRTLLQSMPAAWQHQFVTLVDELHAAFRHVQQAECYDVIPGVEREIGELTDAEMKLAGVTTGDGAPDEEQDGQIFNTAFYDRDGQELEGWERVVLPQPDPVPHYNRGRTRIEPRIDA